MNAPMLTVNSISGGATSAYMAVHYPADYNIFCLVCTDQPDIAPKDPGLRREAQQRVPGFIASRELDHTLKLVLDLEQLIQKPIVWLTAKQGQNEPRSMDADQSWLPKLLTYDRLVATKGTLPNKNARFCTEELKLLATIWWRYLNLPTEPIVMNVGLRADEESRVLKRLGKCDRASIPLSCKLTGQQRWEWKHQYHWREQAFPLWQDGIDEAKVIAFWQAKGWQFPGKPGADAHLAALSSNCDRCFFKRIPEHKAMAALEPERSAWWLEQERSANATFMADLSYEEIDRSDETTLQRLRKGRGVDRAFNSLESRGQLALLDRASYQEDLLCACTD